MVGNELQMDGRLGQHDLRLSRVHWEAMDERQASLLPP